MLDGFAELGVSKAERCMLETARMQDLRPTTKEPSLQYFY